MQEWNMPKVNLLEGQVDQVLGMIERLQIENASLRAKIERLERCNSLLSERRDQAAKKIDNIVLQLKEEIA
jgi:uncharacterized protein (TIGR02449 family)